MGSPRAARCREPPASPSLPPRTPPPRPGPSPRGGHTCALRAPSPAGSRPLPRAHGIRLPEGVLGPPLRGRTGRKVPVCAGRSAKGPPSLLGVLRAPRKPTAPWALLRRPRPPQPHSFPSCARTGWPSSQLHAALPAAGRPRPGPPEAASTQDGGRAPGPQPPETSGPASRPWLPRRGARGSLPQEASLLCAPRCPPHSRGPTYQQEASHPHPRPVQSGPA